MEEDVAYVFLCQGGGGGSSKEGVGGGPVYKASRVVDPINGFTSMPCGMCPVISLCSEHGEISPSSCQYYNKWLEMQGDTDIEDVP